MIENKNFDSYIAATYFEVTYSISSFVNERGHSDLQTRRASCSWTCQTTFTLKGEDTGSGQRIRWTSTTGSRGSGADQWVLLRSQDLPRSGHQSGVHWMGDYPVPHSLQWFHPRSGQGLHHPEAGFVWRNTGKVWASRLLGHLRRTYLGLCLGVSSSKAFLLHLFPLIGWGGCIYT